MRDLVGRRRAVFVALTAAILIALVVPQELFARDPKGLDRFMHAVGQVESGGRYDAWNPDSGAYGKYQIMPSNWTAWAKLYLGDARAKPTPRNQERVARAKFKALWSWLGGWRYVAHWWLTGSGDKTQAHWSKTSRRYVRRVLTIYHGGKRGSTQHVYQDGSSLIAYRGSWPSARHAGYSGDTVKYATHSGARATFTFTGKSIKWIGPKGPTRGRAMVYLDGKLVRTVDLRARTFEARATLFAKSWSKAGRHTLSIVVSGSRGPVAIDEVRVG